MQLLAALCVFYPQCKVVSRPLTACMLTPLVPDPTRSELLPLHEAASVNMPQAHCLPDACPSPPNVQQATYDPNASSQQGGFHRICHHVLSDMSCAIHGLEGWLSLPAVSQCMLGPASSGWRGSCIVRTCMRIKKQILGYAHQGGAAKAVLRVASCSCVCM